MEIDRVAAFWKRLRGADLKSVGRIPREVFMKIAADLKLEIPDVDLEIICKLFSFAGGFMNYAEMMKIIVEYR